jgi:quercetin dioxygenase-like cupin family protein
MLTPIEEPLQPVMHPSPDLERLIAHHRRPSTEGQYELVPLVYDLVPPPTQAGEGVFVMGFGRQRDFRQQLKRAVGQRVEQGLTIGSGDEDGASALEPRRSVVSFPPNDNAAPGPEPGLGFVLGPDDGDPYWWLGSLTINKVTGASTQGAVDIVDHRIPAGYAPPPHVHSHQDEVFLVLQGQFAVRCGDQHWQAGPGSLVFLPRRVPHGFTLSEDGPGRTLLINAPAGFADLITDLGEPAPRLELPGPDVAMPTPERATAASEAHGIHGA